MFKFKFKFIQRFLTAWRLTRDVKLMAVVQDELENRAFHASLFQRANKLTAGLLHREPSNYKPYEVVLQVKNVVSTEEMRREAKTILEESRIENKPKLPVAGRMTLHQPPDFNQKQAIEEHRKKFPASTLQN